MTRDDAPLVLIVDDDAPLREALGELLLSVGIESAGFASPLELLDSALPDRPGCLVMDVRMPGLSGLDFQRRLAGDPRARPILFLTGHGDVAMATQAMKAGAIDFLTKPVRDQSFLDAVTQGIEIDRAQRRSAGIVEARLQLFATLTPRERAVIANVAHGRLNKQIAYDLGISEVTVKLHRGSVMRKMQVASLGELIRCWELIRPHLATGEIAPHGG